MANYEATRYDFDGGNLTDVEGVNTGIIVPWSDTTTPEGFLDCDGSNVSRTTYANLFAVIGTNYGAGDGSTTFGLPDLTDRTTVGKSPTKTQFTTGGANSVTSGGSVSGNTGNTTLSTPTIASHNHPQTRNCRPPPYQPNAVAQAVSTAVTSPGSTGSAGSGGAHSHPASGNFTGGDDSVLQPFLTVKYIIKT